MAPTSDIQLSIPLINRTKYLSDLTSKDSTLTSAADGSIYYTSAQDVRPIGIETIKLTPIATTLHVPAGTFAVDPPAPAGDTIFYKEITGTDPPPVAAPTPSQTFVMPGMTGAPQVNFQSATLESGIITLQVRNRFPFPIDFPSPIIVANAKLAGVVDTNVIARFTFAGVTLQPGGSTQVSSSLANAIVANAVRVPRFNLHAQPSAGAVTITTQSGIEYTVTLTGLVARSATAEIPAGSVNRTLNSSFTIDDSASIQTAQFRSGTLDIALQNNIDAPLSVVIRLNEFVDRTSGTPFTINTSFPGKGTVHVPFNAPSYRLQTAGQSAGTTLSYSATVTSLESQTVRTINSTDYFRVDILPTSSFIVQSVTGRIKPTSFTIGSGASGPNLGDLSKTFSGNLTFDSVRMVLKLTMPNGFPTDYNLRLVAINRKASPSQMDSLAIPPPLGSTQRRLYPGSAAQILLDNSSGFNKFLARFFPNFPDTFIVRGSAVMNPPDVFMTGQGIQTVYDSSKVYASYAVSFPLKLGLVNGIISDTSTIERNGSFSSDLSQSTKGATAYFEIANGLPVQVTFRAALLRKQAFGKPDTILWLPTDGTRTIAAAPVDAAGIVTGARTSAFTVRLTGSEAEKIDQADVIWYRVQVETTGGGLTPVRFRQQDFITVRASANMVYTINKK